MTVSLFYNSSCPDCVRLARLTARMDWLGRVELRTEDSPLGKVPVGEVVVVENDRGRTFTGVYATRKVCLQVPLFFLYGLALYLPPIRALFGREKQGCNGDACEIRTNS